MDSNIHQNLRILASFLLVLSLLYSCTSIQTEPQIAPLEQQIVDLTDLFQAGEKRFQAALSSDSSLYSSWQSVRDQVVVILIDIRWDDGDLEQAQQSGLILGAGSLILTAGHGFSVEGGEILNIRARTSQRREYRLELLEFAHASQGTKRSDFAILQASSDLDGQTINRPQSKSGKDGILVLGYPGALGVDSQGTVVHTMDFLIGPVFPLGLVCRQKLGATHTLYPVAGAIPIQGISGAPVFTANGELLGVFSSLSRRREVTGWYYTFGLSPIPWEQIQKHQARADL